MNIAVDFITVGPFQENTFILWDKESNSALLVDPGDEPGEIISKIKRLDLDPVGIINTHAHLDHVGAVSKIKEEYSIPFYLNKNEKQILEHYPEMCRMFGINPNKIPTVDHWISGDGEMKIDDFIITYLETPGHTPGGTTYMIDGHCFCGDSLFAGSIGRTDLPGGNFTTLMNSLEKLKDELNHDWVIHPGHGPKTSMRYELKHNPFLDLLNC
ncbi:MAG: MBL fold metallo-hydrolase [Candidatus Marinimicrobia bacterium]|nr:MBL fold metallo-hydrolase [Candidatus Neomarinimicrobiota bacterium]